jgi:hypothetical protein
MMPRLEARFALPHVASPHATNMSCSSSSSSSTIPFLLSSLSCYHTILWNYRYPDSTLHLFPTTTTLIQPKMVFFVPFIFLLAAFWVLIGVMLAKWLKQAGHNRPINGRQLNEREIYGGGVGFGRQVGLGGSERDMEGMGRGKGGRVGMNGYGAGRVKGL